LILEAIASRSVLSLVGGQVVFKMNIINFRQALSVATPGFVGPASVVENTAFFFFGAPGLCAPPEDGKT
jgi:hypothetical protein